MKKDARLLLGLAIGLSFVPAHSTTRAAIHPITGELLATANITQGRNAIYGRIFGPSRQPVGDMYVELLD